MGLSTRVHFVFVCLINLLVPRPALPYRFADYVEDTQTSAADIPPPRPPGSDWQRTDAILNLHWSCGGGFGENSGGEGSEYTYGEVTTLGVRQLANEMQIPSSGEPVIFYDLGSGTGKAVTQMMLDNGAVVKRAVGLELATDRHDIAVSALSQVALSTGGDISGIEFVNADALRYDFSDATHIYISSLCFPRSVLDELQDKILGIQGLRVVAALNRLEKLERAGWKLFDAHIQMSWGAGLAKVYMK